MDTVMIWLVLIFAGASVALDTTGCGGKFENIGASETGILKSPNYPNNYKIMDKCIWKLVARANYSVELTIPSMAGQEGFNGSCRDYVEVRDGSHKEALLASICNTSTPTVVKSRSIWLWVKFYSDYADTNKGFTATWRLVYHGYNSQKDPNEFTGCKSPAFCCPNDECVPVGYKCDGVNDCGYVGDGSDEDFWCDYKFIGREKLYGWGFGTGAILCVLVFLLALCLEGYCSCCCPKHCIERTKCYKCMKKLGGSGSRQERKSWPTYMRNPAILKLTGDAEGWQEYQKFDKARDEKKYEKIKRLKLEEEERERERSNSRASIATQFPGNSSPKKLTRQKAFNYEEQPQLEDLEFKEGLTPVGSPNPSPEPPNYGRKTPVNKTTGAQGKVGTAPKKK